MRKNKKIQIIREIDSQPNGYKDIDKHPFLLAMYQNHHHERLVKYLRFTFLLCILLNSIFLSWDYIHYTYETYSMTIFIRVSVVYPVLIFLFYYSGNKNFHPDFQNIITRLGVILLCGIGFIIYTIQSHGYFYDHSRVLIVLVAIYSLSGLEHKRSLLLSLILTIIFIALNAKFNNSISDFFRGLLIISIINVMGFVYTYKRDLLLRSDFIKKQLLVNAANNDSLTGLYNRNYLFKKYEDRVSKSENITFALLDIDYFKKYNDHYGHVEGDQCLIEISNILSEVEDENTIVNRYGGEEFLIISFNNDLQYLHEKMNSVVKSLNNLNIEHKKSNHKKVTFSIGIKEYKNEDLKSDVKILIEEVDKLLYKAKDTGRNKIVT
jgi:diguanylate cyclase (GGDEF)-like protein